MIQGAMIRKRGNTLQGQPSLLSQIPSQIPNIPHNKGPQACILSSKKPDLDLLESVSPLQSCDVQSFVKASGWSVGQVTERGKEDNLEG